VVEIGERRSGGEDLVIWSIGVGMLEVGATESDRQLQATVLPRPKLTGEAYLEVSLGLTC
jgi:hypothetical protein